MEETYKILMRQKGTRTLNQNQEKQPKTELPIKDVMVKGVITIDNTETVRKAAEVMSKLGISCLIALKKRKAAGILTEMDLLKRVIAEGKDPNTTKVTEIMSSPLIMDLGEAVELMFNKKIKKLPVVQGDRLMGLITLTDIARGAPEMLKIIRQLAANQVMPKNIQKVIDRYIV
jgi:signal-transduction protein with cAMP-binding, CBS, and nucleotidyltransferase domain